MTAIADTHAAREALIAAFGVDDTEAPRVLRDRMQRARRAARLLDERVAPGEIALVTGPSGAGKSLLLRSVDEHTASPVRHPPRTSSGRALIDWVHPDPARSIGFLASAGLAEARTFLTPVRVLSQGQRVRASLARLLARQTGGTILFDEFCSVLDTPTARATCLGVARSFRRHATSSRLIVATAREEVARALEPDWVVWVPLEGEAEVLQTW